MTWGSVMHSSLEEKFASGSCVRGPAGSCVVEEAVPRYLTQHEGMILVDICSVCRQPIFLQHRQCHEYISMYRYIWTIGSCRMQGFSSRAAQDTYLKSI